MQWRPRQAEDNAEEREYLVVIPRTWRIWLKHSYPQGVERLVDGPVSLIDKGLNHQHHNKPEYSPGELRIARMASPCSGRLYIQRVLQREWKCTGLTANHPSARIRARVWARSLSTWSIDTQWMVCPGHSASHPGLRVTVSPDSQTMSRDMRQLPFAVAGGSGCMFIVRRATEKLVRHTKMLIDFIHSIYRLCDDIISKSSPQNGHFYLSSIYVNFFDASGH